MGNYKYLDLYPHIRTDMKIFAFLFGLAQLPRGNSNPVANKLCTATCSGETDDWKSYSSNGVTTTGKALNWNSNSYNNNIFKFLS